jgi:hypothetical protein
MLITFDEISGVFSDAKPFCILKFNGPNHEVSELEEKNEK